MTSTKIYFIIIAFIITSINISQAQLLNRLKKRTMDKIENKLEEKVVEEVSEEIARRVMKPVDKAFDSFLRQSYRKEYGEDYSDEQIDSLMNSVGSNYAQFLEAMNTTANIPPSYTFEFQFTIETKEENGKKHQATMWLGSEDNVMGIQQQDDSNSFIVMDMKNDNVVLYSEKDGKKTAQAIPSMMSIAGAMITSNKDFQDHMDNMTIEGPGKTKTIEGYAASLYKVETEDDMSEYYVSTEVPFSFHESFYKSMTQYFPTMYNSKMESMKGMMLEGETYDKKSKKKSYYKTKNIKQEVITIDNNEYQQTGIVE